MMADSSSVEESNNLRLDFVARYNITYVSEFYSEKTVRCRILTCLRERIHIYSNTDASLIIWKRSYDNVLPMLDITFRTSSSVAHWPTFLSTVKDPTTLDI